jgi:hypothetical protein
VFLQNYQAPGIFGINELFFYRKFGGIGPRSVDWVHGGRSMSPRTLIKWKPSADGSMAQIKTREGVSDNLIVAVNAGMNDLRWLGQQGWRDRGKVYTYGIVATRRSHLAHLGMEAGGWRWWGDSAQARRQWRRAPGLLWLNRAHQRGRRSSVILPWQLIWHGQRQTGAAAS